MSHCRRQTWSASDEIVISLMLPDMGCLIPVSVRRQRVAELVEESGFRVGPWFIIKLSQRYGVERSPEGRGPENGLSGLL